MPAGTYEYKVAVDDAWDEAYGLDGGSANIPLTIGGTLHAAVRLRRQHPPSRPRGRSRCATATRRDDDALVAAPVRQPGADEQFYFVMTDRFDNGDASNDTGGLTGDRLATGFDPTDKGFYNGGDIAGLRCRLDYIEGLGTTRDLADAELQEQAGAGRRAPTRAPATTGTGSPTSRRSTRTSAPTPSSKDLIDDAHARGHQGLLRHHHEPHRRCDLVRRRASTPTSTRRRARTATPTARRSTRPSYAGTEHLPGAGPGDMLPLHAGHRAGGADVKVPAWLNDVTLYHNRGDSTCAGESMTLRRLLGLDDLMTEHPAVVDGFVDVYQNWIDLGIDGFRIDTAKHVNFEFWQKWSTRGARLRARARQARLLHVRRGLRRRPGRSSRPTCARPT